MSENINDLYRDIIMDHYKYPRGRKRIDKADVKNEGKNPVCGDEIELSLKVDNGSISDLGVECAGCAISVASGSMLADSLKGKSLAEVRKIAQIVKEVLKGDKPEEEIDLGDLEALEGVKNFPVRVKCALLAWTTLIDGLESWESKKPKIVSTTE
jgi:nitrogen fixation NifU-like protein